MGMLELGITFDLTQLVMDNEMTRMISRAVEGISINDENMGLDVIKQVGPGGNFLSTEHTLRHMREQSHSKLIDMKMWQPWQNSGSKGMVERAHEELLSILKNHKPEPLSAGMLAALHSIVENAEKEILERKRGK